MQRAATRPSEIRGSRGQSIDGKKPTHSVQTIPAPASLVREIRRLPGGGRAVVPHKAEVGRLAERPQKESPDVKDFTTSEAEV